MSQKNSTKYTWENSSPLYSWDESVPIEENEDLNIPELTNMGDDFVSSPEISDMQNIALPQEGLSTTVTTVDTSDQILKNEIENPNSSDAVFQQIAEPDYELNQKVDSSDYGLFQINDKTWNETSNSMFGKPVGDLNDIENIELASFIAREDPRSWNNWVAFNKGNHKQFKELTDEQISETYNIPLDVIDYINQSFDNPALAKQVMLAESGGKSTAVNVNYTPQEEGKETISNETKKTSESIVNQSQLTSPSFEVVEPATTATIDFETQQNMIDMGGGLPYSIQAKDLTEFVVKGLTGQYSGVYDTPEFESSKEAVEFSTNILSTLAEFGGMPFDIVTELSSEPVQVVKGLLTAMPEEFLLYAQALNVIDVVNPVLGLFGPSYTKEELDENRKKARKYIFDTGGVYAYFAATGLASVGRKNPKIAQKNKEFPDVVELANDRQPKNIVTNEQRKAAESLKKNPNLLQQAEKIVNEQLQIDFIEPKTVDKLLEKADDLVEKSLDLEGLEPLELGTSGKVTSISRFYDRQNKIHIIQKLDKKGNQIGEAQYAPNAKQAQSTVIELKKKFNITKTKKSKPKQKTKSTEIDLDRDVPSPKTSLFVKKNKIKNEVGVTQQKIENLKKKQKSTTVSKKQADTTPELVEKIKLTKSSDLNVGKNIEPIKGESARRFKTKEKLDKYIEEKLSDYVGQNIIARFGELKQGGFVVKIFKRTKDQPLPITATKRAPLKIADDIPDESIVKMRDPRSLKRRIQNQDLLAERYSTEVSELNRNLNIQLDELFKLQVNAIESGITSPRIALLRNSIDATTKLINKSQADLRLLMSSKDLLKRVGKNISQRTAKGAVGKNVGKNVKEKAKQRLLDQELISDIQQLWSNGKTGYKITKKGLIRYLKEINASPKTIRYVSSNFKRISDEAFIDNAKKLSSQLAEEIPQSSGPVIGSKVRKRPSEEMFANIRVEIMSGRKPDAKRLAMVDMFENLVNNVGGKKTEKAKGTRSIKTIQNNARTKATYAKYIESIHYKKNLKFDIRELAEIQTVGVDHVFSLVEEFARTENNALRPLINEALLSVESLISEPARALRNLREIQAMSINDWTRFEKIFPDNPDMLDIVRRIVKNEEIDRNSLFKIIEYARNAKLATGSAVVRSVAGNTFAGINAYARMPFEYGYDWVLNNIIMKPLYELTNGQYGNLSKNQITRHEILAQVRGHYNGFAEAGRLSYDMLFERDNALQQSAFFKNEGFTYRDIKGKKGVVIRTPQRVQGIVDIMYRVPLTNGFFYRNSIRQAVREGYKESSDILRRADEIIKSESLDADLVSSAIKDGKYNVFQSELEGIGKVVNQWRGGNQWYNALGQFLIPFFNTAGNLFRYTLEHTPANLVMRDFRKGFVEAFTPPRSQARKKLERKLVTQAQEEGGRTLAKELSKVTTGLGAMYLLNHFIVKNSNDNISGDWSDMFPEERNMRTNLGQQEYSIRLNDGNWVSYRGFEPVSSYLTMIQSYQKTALDTKDEELKKKLAEQTKSAVTEIAKSFVENPFFAGTGDLFKALHRRKDWAEFAFGLVAGGALPGIVRQYANIIDPIRRSRLKLSDVDENIDYIDVLKSQGANVLPWFTDKNLPFLDPFGREIDKPDPLGGIFAMRYTEAKTDPVYQEIQKVFFDRDVGFSPANPVFTNTEFAKIGLTPNEHWTLIKVSGEALYDAINSEMQKEYWQQTKPAIKANIITDAKDRITDYFRKEMFDYLKPIKKDMIDAEIENIISNNKERLDFLKQKRSEFQALTLEDLRERARKAKESPQFGKISVPYLD